ncbi:MAG TPA: barstar family protein [Nocardioidaceae bacterium]|jgi:hypothetical protein
MSGLAALLAGHNPPDVYQWHSAAHVEDIEHAVEKAGWRMVHLDGWTIEDRQSFLKATASAFSLPDSAADSVETLGDALAGLDAPEGAAGLVMLWDGWSPLCRHDERCFQDCLSVFRRRVDDGARGRFAVLLRGDGPPLDLPELPAKHP